MNIILGMAIVFLVGIVVGGYVGFKVAMLGTMMLVAKTMTLEERRDILPRLKLSQETVEWLIKS